MAQPSDAGYGPRVDGTPKGRGFFGALPHASGGVATELSFDFDHPKYGKVLAPLLVPSLNRKEIDLLLSGAKPTDEIFQKAQDFAIKRIEQNLSPFALPNELYPVPSE